MSKGLVVDKMGYVWKVVMFGRLNYLVVMGRFEDF